MRWIARFFMILALVFLAMDVRDAGEGIPEVDGEPVIKGDPVILRALGERWFRFDQESYQLISPAVSRHVSPWLDDAVVQPPLLQPAFLVFFVLWLIFSFFSWLIRRARHDEW